MSDPDLLMDPVQRFVEMNPTTEAIIASEQQAEAAADAENVAYRGRRDANRETLGHAQFALARYQDAQQKDPKTLARLEKEVAKAMAARDKIEKAYAETYKGHMMDPLREFFAKGANVNARYEPADTQAEYLKGKSAAAMCKHWQDVKLAAERELDATILAPFCVSELRGAISDGVDALSKSLRAAVSSVRRPEFNERAKSFKPRQLRLPEVTIADGLGGVSKFPDATGLLCEVFREPIINHLMQIATDEFGGEGSDMAERNRRVAALSAEIEKAEYHVEFFARECKREGTHPPARSTNPLAILDLRRVR